MFADQAFRLFPRIQGNEFYNVDRDPERGGSSVTLTNFESNYDEDAEEAKDTKKGEPGFCRGGDGSNSFIFGLVGCLYEG
jgi:hypothetical protein